MSEADAQQVMDSVRFDPPATSFGTSPTEAFSASFDAGRSNTSEYSQFGNMSSALQDHLDTVKRKTGQQFDNPLADYTTNPQAPSKLANTAQALYELSAKQNDPSLAMPDGDTLYEQGAMKARASQRAEDEAMAAPISTLGKGAAFLGGLAGRSTDPLFLANNTIAMLGFGAGGPLAAAALKSAISMGTAQLGTALGSMDFKRAVNPEYGYGDIAKETAEAAGMAAGAEVGGRGIAALWRQLRGRAPSVAAMTPQLIADAANVAERASDLEANNPFKTGLTGAQAHHDAVTQLEIPLARGEPLPQAPASVVAEAKVPAGQVFAGGRAVDVKYELAEARDLITSHDQNFMTNPGYPAELQPRERGNIASRAQVYDMAANLEPARLGPSPEANAGAPLVGPDNVVESGNGRVMAIRSAHDQGLDQSGAYRAFLERSGFDTSQVRQPVLIARRTTDMAPSERADFAHAANASAALRLGTTEQAMSDARHIDSGLIDRLKSGALDSAGNRDFHQAFAGKLTPGEAGGMLTKGGDLSAIGLQRVKAAVVARAYSDAGLVSRAFEHPDSNIKTIANALTDAAPDWIKMRDAFARGVAPATQDVTADLMASIKAIMRARDNGKPVWEILNQGDIFHSDTSSLAARLFFKDGSFRRFLSKGDMADNLSTVARDVASSAERGPDMFGAAPITPKEAIEARAGTAEQRAIEQGFTIPAIHATHTPFKEFDISKAGSTTDHGFLGKGFYFVPKTQEFTGNEGYNFGGLKNQRQFPVRLRAENPFVVVVKSPGGILEPDVYDANWLELEKHGWTEGTLPTDEYGPGTEGIDDFNKASEAFTKAVKAAGHDSVIVKTPDGQIEEIAVFDTKNIRSQFDQYAPEASRRGGLYASELTPDLVDKIHDDPAVHDAMVADLQRNIEQGKNKVPITDENGNSALGVADKELHNAERQEMLAKEIGGCAGGPAVEAAE